MPVPTPSQAGILIEPGDVGDAVRTVQQRLLELGFSVGAIDASYGARTQQAVAAFQHSRGLRPTGLVDGLTLQALGFEVDPQASRHAPGLDADTVARLFPGAPIANIQRFLPLVMQALHEVGLADRQMVLMALATIRAETGSFAPIDEYQSKYNTESGGRPFGKYDFRQDLGNSAIGDGARFKGRGFIQLTGKDNYGRYSRELGLGDLLLNQPEKANDPLLAARLLARFLKRQEGVIRQALSRGDLAAARRAVNGGSHGLDVFSEAFRQGNQLLA